MANIDKSDELDWVKIREDIGGDYAVETTYEKIIRKTRENPLVPIGSFATVTALTVGLYNLYHGRSRMQQYMMRMRVGAQAFTIVAIIVGTMLQVKNK